MTKTIRKTVLIAASLILLIGATGCMENNTTNTTNTTTVSMTPDEAQTAVLDYLSKKYGVSFECVGYEKPSIINNKYSFALVETGKSYDGYGFKAHYTPNSQEAITAGYFGVLVRDEITDLIFNSSFCDDCKVFTEVSRSTFDVQLNSSSTLSDAVEIHGKLRVYYYIFISSTSEYDIIKLKESIPADMLSGKLSYYVVSEYNNLNTTLGGVIDGTISVESKGEFDF